MKGCKKCGNNFKYIEILKSIWLSKYEPIICSECNKKNYVKLSTKLILSFSIFAPLFIRNLVFLFTDHYYKFYISLYITLFIIAILITPFYARYNTKKEEQDDGTKALLVSSLNNIEAEVIVSLLESYEIPYMKKSTGIGPAMEIYTGANNYGIDIYVPSDMLQIAKDIINPNNVEDLEQD